MKVTFTFWKEQSVLATVLQIVAAVSLLVAIVFCCATIGVFAKEFNHLKDQAKGYDGDICFLYASRTTVGPIPTIKFGKDSYCEFIIYGQGIVLITLAVLVMLLMLTVFIKFDSGLEAIPFLVVAVISFLLCFIASIVLSTGFSKTCKAVDDYTDGAAKCGSDDLNSELQDIYRAMAQSTGLSWIETMSIGILLGVAGVYLAMRLSRRGYKEFK